MFGIDFEIIINYLSDSNQDPDEDALVVLISDYINESGDWIALIERVNNIQELLSSRHNSIWVDEVILALIESVFAVGGNLEIDHYKLRGQLKQSFRLINNVYAKILAESYFEDNFSPETIHTFPINQYSSRLMAKYLEINGTHNSQSDEQEYSNTLLQFFAITRADDDPAYFPEDGAALSLQFLGRMRNPDPRLFDVFFSQLSPEIDGVGIDFFVSRRNEELLDYEQLIEVIS